MRLLYIHQYFVFPDTPGATRSFDLATGFVHAGNEVIIITSSSFLHGSFTKRWTILHRDGLEVHVLRSNYSNQLSFIKRLMVFLGFMCFASARALRIRADLVLATSTPITVAVPALIKRMWHETKFVFETRDIWPEAPIALGAIRNKLLIKLIEAFEKYIYQRAAHIVALSPDMKTSIVTRTGTVAGKITVIPNIANIERFEHFDPQRSLLKELVGFVPKRSFIYAGTFGVVNGVENLLGWIKQVSFIDPEIKFIFMGWGSQKPRLIELSKTAGLLNRTIFFVPPQPKNMLPQLYHECTVTSSFVIPVNALWANSANKFFDAMAAGKPIVINYEGWQAKLIREHQTGYVLDHGLKDPEKMAAEFCVWIQQEALIKQQGENARALAPYYSLPNAIQQYLHIFEKIS